MATGALPALPVSPPSFRAIKRFFGSISIVVLLNLLVKPGWVVVENLVQDRLGHATFGLVTATASLAIMVTVVADLGLTSFSVQRLAAEPRFVADHFPLILPLRAWLSALALVLTIVIGVVLGYRGTGLYVLIALAVSLMLTQYGQFLRGTLQASQRFNTDAIFSVLEKALLLGLVLACLPIGLTLSRYVGARLAAAAFTMVLLYALMTRLFGRVRFRFGWARARNMLGQSLPFALSMVLYGLNERVDMVMLERLASPTEAGYYAGAYRWVDAVMMYAWTVLPLFFAKFAATPHDRAAQRDLLWFGQRVITVPLLLAAAFVFFRGELLFWQFKNSSPEEVERMAWCARLLFGNVLVQAFSALYATLLNSTGYVRQVSWLIVLSVTLNIILNLFTLRQYGAEAAAWNTLICATLVSGGYVGLVWRRARVQVPWGLLARLLLAFGGLCAGWYGLRACASLPWLPETALASLLFAALLLGLRIVTPAELRQLRPGRRVPGSGS